MFLVFAGAAYYPNGGDDLRRAVRLREEAIEMAKMFVTEKPSHDYLNEHDWSEVYEVDASTLAITKIASFTNGLYGIRTGVVHESS